MKIQKPKRVSRTRTQTIEGSIDQIFPLYCPVREVDWVKGWDPVAVYSESGVVEPDCVFVTPGEPSEAVWYVNRYDKDRGYVEMLKIVPGLTACKLQILVEPAGEGRTSAQVTYTHTSLGPEGDKLIEGFTEEHYASYMKAWEDAMHHYLRTGKMLEA